jgi:hypothetical protein
MVEESQALGPRRTCASAVPAALPSMAVIRDAGGMRFRLFGHRRRTTTGERAHRQARSYADHPDPTGAAGLVLANEAEAYVNGELATLRVAQKRSLAPWMLINRPAHCDPIELQQLAHGEPCPMGHRGIRRRDRAWASAQHWLAIQIVESAGDPDQIRHLQRTVLVPLELRLIARTTSERLALGNVLADTTDALDDYRLGQ